MQFSLGHYLTKPGVCARLVSQEPSNETLKHNNWRTEGNKFGIPNRKQRTLHGSAHYCYRAATWATSIIALLVLFVRSKLWAVFSTGAWSWIGARTTSALTPISTGYRTLRPTSPRWIATIVCKIKLTLMPSKCSRYLDYFSFFFLVYR